MSARPENVPPHVAIIMDGNGRWAKQRGLPRIEGHRRGVETVRTITFDARDLGVRMLTLYAFSIENWKRPPDEVQALMGLLEFYLKRELQTFVRERVQLRTIGRTDELPSGVQKVLRDTVEETRRFTDYTLVLALNYGSRTEVVDAARAYAAAVAAGKEKLNDSSWATFRRSGGRHRRIGAHCSPRQCPLRWRGAVWPALPWARCPHRVAPIDRGDRCLPRQSPVIPPVARDSSSAKVYQHPESP